MYLNKLTHLKEASKCNYYANLLRICDYLANTRKKLILRKRRPLSSFPVEVKINNCVLTYQSQICNPINKFFITVDENNVSVLPSSGFQFKAYLGDRCLASIVSRPTDEHEILNIMSHFDERKLTGHIDVPVKLIKAARFLIALHLEKS